MTKIISTIAAALLLATACTKDGTVEFTLDNSSFDIGADGGVRTFRVSSDTEWIASTQQPWITVSPANGRGSAECRILIDSALTVDPREGLVVIEQQNAEQKRERLTVRQEGFGYAISVEETDRDIEIDNFTDYDSRYFEVVVTSNVEFEVVIPDKDQNWLSLDSDKSGSLNLNRGVRPRERRLRFNWGINSIPEQRLSEITFRPTAVDEGLVAVNDVHVTQKAAAKIEENTRQGDSVALLGVQRSLGVWSGSWDSSTPMDEWSGVKLWQDGPNKGRVRSASFYLFGTKDSVIPYEIQYLTACEELDFFSNINSFLYSFEDTGEYLAKLGETGCLKRLYLDAMGYTDLPESFGKLKDLEYLSLMFNNFQKVPEVINGSNFKNLKRLVMNGNRRNEIMDLSTTVYSDYGGFVDEENLLDRLFTEFPQLDTLVLGINYLHGTIPDYEGAEYDDTHRWTGRELDGLKPSFTDSLPQGLIDGVMINDTKRTIPKVMPQLQWFTIIGNRYTGQLPLWLLYHPHLEDWVPFQLVFVQEGRTLSGALAGFDNEPVNLEYYYDFYEGYKSRPSDEDDESDTATYRNGNSIDSRGVLDGAARLLMKKGLAPDGRKVTK